MKSHIPEEVILQKIYLIRERKIMLDMDLSALYGIDTKQLKRAVRRNIQRFPEDFMFELTKEELKNWRCQFGTSNLEKMGIRIPPFAFTEHGVLMLSSVLNSESAINTNIQIIRIFNRMREIILHHKEMLKELAIIKNQLHNHSKKILVIFEYLDQLEQRKQKQFEQENRTRIGFKPK